MPTRARYSVCTKCESWIGLPRSTREQDAPLDCPQCGAQIEVEVVGAFQRPPRRLPEVTDYSVTAIEQWTQSVKVYRHTWNIARIERLARAWHVYSEVRSNQPATPKILELGIAVIEAVQRFKLPYEAFLDSDRRTPRRAKERLRAALAVYDEPGPLAFDLDTEEGESLRQRQFYPKQMFSLTLALCAARLLLDPSNATQDADLAQLQEALLGRLHDLLRFPCPGSRIVNVALGAVDVLGPREREQWFQHQEECQERFHVERALSAMPVAAKRGWIPLEQCYERIRQRANQLSERGRTKISETLASIDDLPRTLLAILELAQSTGSSDGHRNVMEAAREALRLHAFAVEFWPADLRVQLKHVVQSSMALAPRKPHHAADTAASLLLLSQLCYLLWRGVPSLPFIASLRTLAESVVSVIENLPSGGAAAFQSGEHDSYSQGILEILRGQDSRLFQRLQAEVQSLPLSEDGLAVWRRLRDQRRALRQGEAAPNNQEHLRGCLFSAYINSEQSDTLFKTAWPAWSQERERHLRGLYSSLRIDPANAETRRTFWQAAMLSDYIAGSISSRDFWPTFARRQFLVEAHLFLLRAAEPGRTDGDGFVFNAASLSGDQHVLADRYYECRAPLLPNGLSIEGELSFFGEPEVPAYPAPPGTPATDRRFLLDLRQLFSTASWSDLISFCRRVRQVPLPRKYLNSPSEALLRWFADLVLGDIGEGGRSDAPARYRREPQLTRMLWDCLPERSTGASPPQLTPGAAAPVLLEFLVRTLVRTQPARGWLGPQVRDLGELMALLRRDPGVGARWHSRVGNPLYADIHQEASASLITLSRMSHLVASRPFTPGDMVDGIPCGAVERCLLAGVRGAICEMAVGMPGQGVPYEAFLRERYTLTVEELHKGTGLPLRGFRLSEIFFPERLLRLLASTSHHSLLRHVRDNAYQPPQGPGEVALAQENGLVRYAFWFFGSRRWGSTEPTPLLQLAQHDSVSRHRILKHWMELWIVGRDSDRFVVIDAHTRRERSFNELPEQARHDFAQLSSDFVAYYSSVALHHPTSVERVYGALLEPWRWRR